MHHNQASDLLSKSTAFSEKHGADVCKMIEANSLDLIKWSQFNASYKRTGIADELIDSTLSAIRETAACLSLGLVRPALFSLRAQIDLILTWLYFKDHPIEWNKVNSTGEGFKLKTEVIKYLTEMYPQFSSRFNILKQTKSRKEEDPYRLLSAHIHAQSTAVIPVVNSLSDTVSELPTVEQCAAIQFEVSEYATDILAAIFLQDHVKFDPDILQKLRNRPNSDAQRLTLFDGT